MTSPQKTGAFKSREFGDCDLLPVVQTVKFSLFFIKISIKLVDKIRGCYSIMLKIARQAGHWIRVEL